jgi:hypothetical protein
MTRQQRLTVILATFLFGPVSVAAPAFQEKQEQKKATKSESAAMTGCVDEQNGHYVLTNDTDLARIAILEADGFPTEAFAKHMGHKVTVQGTSIPGGAQPTFKVRTVVAVSDTCAPVQQK